MMKIETIGDYAARWGEGPFWHQDRLFYVDIEDHKLCSVNPATGEESFCEAGERIGFAVPRASGGFVMGGDNGLAFLDFETGTKTPIADPEPDKKPDNRFNDGKCDPAGRVWAGTISTVKKEGDASLYCLDTDLSLTKKVPDVTNSNGLAWTKDNRTFYYIDTPTKTIRAYDFDLAKGEITGERIAIDTKDLEGSPDGMTIDENDHLWVAFCRGGCVRCFDPSTGTILNTIELPVSGPTSCAFGGGDFETLFITTGQFPNLDEPGAGRVYAVNPGVKGRPTVSFAG